MHHRNSYKLELTPEERQAKVSSKKRILAYSIYYYPEIASTAQLYTELFEELSTEFDITVICAVPCYTGTVPEEYGAKGFYFEEHGGVRIVRVPVRPYSKSNKIDRVLNIIDFYKEARRATRSLCKETEFDLVFTYSQPPILGGMLGVFGSRTAKAPLIYGIQDFNPEQTIATGYAGNKPIHSAMMALDKRTCKHAATVVLPGRDLAETLRTRFRNHNVPPYEIIPNWADDSSIVPLNKAHPKILSFRAQYGLADKFVIMYSGNLGLYYDLQNLIKIFEEFQNDNDVVFALVGDGAIKTQLMDYVKSHNVQNIVFIPYQPIEKLPYSINAADVHLVTNAQGIKGVSCPSKAYGVMASNVPMLGILEPESEIWCAIEESNCGTLAEAGDYDAVRKALTAIISQRAAYVAEHSTGRAFLETHYSKARAFDQYRKLFSSAITQQR